MKDNKIKVKSEKEIKIMAEGGKKLAKIKTKVAKRIKEGIKASEIEDLTDKLIKEQKGKASFKMVPGYKWATCVNINQGVVHGIPHQHIIFKKGDIVSVDIGFYYQGFHTDTSFSLGVGAENNKFLETGRKTLDYAIDKARVGNKIFDISKTIEDSLNSNELTPIRALVGHGIGRDLHEAPQIPCFTSGKRSESLEIPEGAVLAIEVMYTFGKPGVTLAGDGWTIETKDGKISGLFEETVAVTAGGPVVLTKN